MWNRREYYRLEDLVADPNLLDEENIIIVAWRNLSTHRRRRLLAY